MIGKIQGIIDTIADGYAIVMTGGVGYRVLASSSSLAKLSVGQPATFWIETHVREDHINLIGFLTSDEHNMFNVLTTIQGIGPKAGLAILGTLTPAMIINAVMAGDKRALSAAPGIGAKVAERMITELKSKIKNLASAALPELDAAPNAPVYSDAVAALEGLGYKRAAIIPVVREILDAAPATPLDQIIMQALKVL